MPIDDPGSWAQGAAAIKTAFESLRSAIGLVKDVRSLGGGSEQQQKAIDVALTTASSSTAIAEAEVAKALGYELCKCEFPPTPMLTVGYRTPYGKGTVVETVYECPKCGYCTAGGWAFARTKPSPLAAGS